MEIQVRRAEREYHDSPTLETWLQLEKTKFRASSHLNSDFYNEYLVHIFDELKILVNDDIESSKNNLLRELREPKVTLDFTNDPKRLPFEEENWLAPEIFPAFGLKLINGQCYKLLIGCRRSYSFYEPDVLRITIHLVFAESFQNIFGEISNRRSYRISQPKTSCEWPEISVPFISGAELYTRAKEAFKTSSLLPCPEIKI